MSYIDQNCEAHAVLASTVAHIIKLMALIIYEIN